MCYGIFGKVVFTLLGGIFIMLLTFLLWGCGKKGSLHIDNEIHRSYPPKDENNL